jgi:hypothetical protein
VHISDSSIDGLDVAVRLAFNRLGVR